ncbi:hypothetical protein L208DRAFT_1380587 [Tricholoma matsutake]|nr:hypothetical protein L208DRAFT_1380587 [Tricholoma matsutake 945]
MTPLTQPTESEQARRRKNAATFVEEMACTKGFFACAVCAHTFGLYELQTISLVNLASCGSLGPLPESKLQGETLSEGMMLCHNGLMAQDDIQSARLCEECLDQLHEGHAPGVALNGNHNIGTVPNALQGLTFLETLYIALCLPLEYIVSFSDLGTAMLSLKITPRAQTCAVTHCTLPLRNHDVQRMVLLDWHLEKSTTLPSLMQLTIRKARVVEALEWLQSNNPFYENVALDTDRVQQLPEDGLPDWIAQQVEERAKTLLLDGAFDHYKDFPLVDDDTFAKAFPHIFPHGHVPFKLAAAGGAREMGKWAATHNSKRFDNQPGFFHLLLETRQHDEVAIVAAQIPGQVEGTCWGVRLKYLNVLLAKVIGADITGAVLHSKADGISARRAPAQRHRHIPQLLFGREPTYGGTQSGMFGKTLAFLATVEHRVANTLALRMVLWTDNVHPTTMGCYTRAVYNRVYSGEECNRKIENGNILKRCATERASHLFKWHPMGSAEGLLVQHEQEIFYNAFQGSYTAKIALAMTTTLNDFEPANWREKIVAAARCIVRSRSWSEAKQLNTFRGIRTGDGIHAMRAEGRHEGLLRSVDVNMLMPRLTGGLSSKDDSSMKGVAWCLGLLKPWMTVKSLRGDQPTWRLAWDSFEMVELRETTTAELWT